MDIEFTTIIDNLQITWGSNDFFGYYVLVLNTELDKNDPNFVVLEKDTTINHITQQDVIDLVSSYGVDPIRVANSLVL